MPFPPQKNENYRNLGGMNTKASLYITGESEFLNLQNVDFRTPGALSSFAGSTQISTSGATSMITGIANYLFYLAANTTFSPLVNTSVTIATDANYVYGFTNNGFQVLLPYLWAQNTNDTNFTYMNSSLFGANGMDNWTYQGSTAWQFSLPKPMFGTSGSAGSNTATGGISGTIVMYYALVRSDGLIGPYSAVTYQAFNVTTVQFNIPYGPNLRVGATLSNAAGLSFGSFGLSGIQAWLQWNGGTPLGLTFLLPLAAAGSSNGVGISICANFSAVGWNLQTPQPLDFQGSFLYGLGADQGQVNGSYLGSGNPSLVESFAGQLFSAAFSNLNNNRFGSRIVFSNPGTPEQANYTNFFDVALEDPEPISCMKTYYTYLMIGKPSSLWALSGTGPDTFNLSLITRTYGVLNPRACCVWNQVFWFLDRKGIMEFNGALVQPSSSKIQSIFDTMNVPVAKSSAFMVHVKERNEVWTAIPTSGASFNNLLIVYDYLTNAWTTRTMPAGNVTALSLITGGDNKQTVYYGTSTGLIGTFGSSLMGDNGVAFTSVIKSRFIDDLGQSVQKLYRRFYLDASVAPGQTFIVQANFYTDKSATYTYSATMVLGAFQNRIDFGISAKSVAVELIYNGATFLQINGFTLEYRYLRNV